MARRNVLVVHPSEATRRTIDRFLYSELSDADVHHAADCSAAEAALARERFDIVIAAKDCGDSNCAVIRQAAEASSGEGEQDTAFIVLAKSLSQDETAEFNDAGILHVLPVPFSGADLVRKVQAVCDPRRWREHQRVYIPGATVTVHRPHRTVDGFVMNLSRGGALCDFTYFEDHTDMFGCTNITLRFPEDAGGGDVTVWSDFCRIHVLRWKDAETPETLRTAWRFLDMEPDAEKRFETILENAVMATETARVTE